MINGLKEIISKNFAVNCPGLMRPPRTVRKFKDKQRQVPEARKPDYCEVTFGITFGVRQKLKSPAATSKGLPSGATTCVIDKSWIRPLEFLDSTVTVNCKVLSSMIKGVSRHCLPLPSDTQVSKRFVSDTGPRSRLHSLIPAELVDMLPFTGFTAGAGSGLDPGRAWARW